jgi:hypothetical protein
VTWKQRLEGNDEARTANVCGKISMNGTENAHTLGLHSEPISPHISQHGSFSFLPVYYHYKSFNMVYFTFLFYFQVKFKQKFNILDVFSLVGKVMNSLEMTQSQNGK